MSKKSKKAKVTKTCDICHIDYTTFDYQFSDTCPNCRLAVRNVTTKKPIRKAQGSYLYRPADVRKRQAELTKVAGEAKAAGMSYGKYVAGVS